MVGPPRMVSGERVGQRIPTERKVFGGLLPKNIVVRVAARTTPGRCGWSKASIRASQSEHAPESKMSESPRRPPGFLAFDQRVVAGAAVDVFR